MWYCGHHFSDSLPKRSCIPATLRYTAYLTVTTEVYL